MTSRERVLTAISHQQPDRVPIDFGGHRSSGIAAIAYAKLKQKLGINTGDIYVYDMLQQLAIIEKEVLEVLGGDVIELGRGFMVNETNWEPWLLPDGTPCKIPSYINVEKRSKDCYLLSDDGVDLAIQKEGCLYFEQIFWPWLNRDINKQDFADLGQAFNHTMWTGIPAPGAHLPFTESGLAELSAGAKSLREKTDRAIIGIFGGNLFETPQLFYRNDNYLSYLALYPEACLRLSEAFCHYYKLRLEKWLQAVGDSIDIILFVDDLGGQNGPLISPNMYRRYYKPFHEEMWRMVKKIKPHLRIQLHSCGAIEPLLDDLIDAGLEMANPVQISCQDMAAEHLKKKYGDRFTFWGGGCDTRAILPKATPEQVKEHVRQQIAIFNPSGGFVFQQVHNILADVPPENIIAMFEAVHESG